MKWTCLIVAMMATYCMAFEEGICRCFGDPHCVTFDHQQISYQGTCPFLMVANKNAQAPDFQIWATNIFPSFDRKFSYVGRLDVLFSGYNVSIRQMSTSPSGPVEVFLQGARVNLPFMSRDFKLLNTPISVRLVTNMGLEVELTRNWYATVNISGYSIRKTFNLTGFCGNFNGERKDDLVTSDGEYVGHLEDPGLVIGNSYVSETATECYKPISSPLSECSSGTSSRERNQALEMCKRLNEAKSFRRCLESQNDRNERELVTETFQRLCQFDAIATCSNISAEIAVLTLASICTELRTPPEPFWREELNIACICPDPRMICDPPKEEVKCRRTCLDPKEEQTKEICRSDPPIIPGECRCPEDLVLLNGACVEKEKCGCIDRFNTIYDEGSTWLEWHCRIKYTCNDGKVESSKHRCEEGTICRDGLCVKRRPISEDAVDITDLNPKFIPSLETTTRICDHHRISEEDDESYQDTTTEDEGEIYECVSEEEPDTEEATTVEECTEGEETTTEEMTTEEETTTEDFSTCEDDTTTEEDNTTEDVTTCEDDTTTEDVTTEEETTTEDVTTCEDDTTTEETTTEDVTTEEETTTEDVTTCEDDTTTEDVTTEDDTTTEEDNTTEDVTTCEDDTTTEDVTTEEETTTEETTTEDVTTEEETTTCEDDSTTEDKLTTKETPRRYDTCKFSGLAYPYFDTFDSQKLEYQGLCRFILAMNQSSTLPGFKVMAVNFAPSFDDVPQADSGKVAYVGRLDVLLGDFEISLRQLQSSPKETVEVYINNVIVDLPHDISPIFDIRRSRSSVRLTTPFGLEVELSSDWQARIVLPEEFKSQVTGFCGNFNENPEDDLMTKEGKLVDGPNAGSEIGDSFIDSEWKDYSCRKRKVGQNAECSEESAEKIREGLERCRAAKEEFSMCSEDIQETIREMVDECEANVRRICSSLSALHLVDIMISIKCWRQPGIQSFPRVTQKPCYCPDPRMICGPSKPTECPRTCLNPEGGQSPEDCPERESLEENECFCPDDYVLHDDVCLKEEECGCVDRERKVVHEEGSTWLNFDCTIKFRCKNGVIREEKFICPRERKCRGGFCIPYF